ncbi:MAG: GFA family protein [Hyphomicrobiaceae bacterium]
MRHATCCCGQLSVTCRGEPGSVSMCHCLACQKRTGSTYGLAAFFTRDAVSISGTASSFSRRSDSGHVVMFHFCPECGSTVYWEPRRKPDTIAVAVGAFADPTFPAPGKSHHTAHRHHWLSD